MKVIGVTGGVGCGKTYVLNYLAKEYKMDVLQADLLAKSLMEPGGASYASLVKLLGEDVLSADGTIDRGKMASLIFGDDATRDKVNKITHPLVKKAILETIREHREKGDKWFVIEAALLIDDHYSEICDELWYIYADNKIRSERLREQRGYSDEKIAAMMASQRSEEQFREACDHVIHNNGDFEITRKEIRELLGEA